MKIVVLDGYTENPGDLTWKSFSDLAELTVYDRTDCNNEEEIISRIGDAELVITNKTPLSMRIMQLAPNIKYIGVLATGYNVIDIKAAKELNITVSNIPSYGTHAVAQFAIALLLEICHRIGHHGKAVEEGRWSSNPDWCFWDYPLIELYGKTFGVIGFGRIGQATASIAHSLGMNIIAFDDYAQNKNHPYANFVSLDELLQQSDVISLHCPLLPETEEIICEKTISKMKDGVIIINNSRGQLINESDLATALNNSKVYAAGLDVVSLEPIRSDNPLMSARNCIITPHISWASKESRARLMSLATDNIKAFLSGSPINVVNK